MATIRPGDQSIYDNAVSQSRFESHELEGYFYLDMNCASWLVLATLTVLVGPSTAAPQSQNTSDASLLLKPTDYAAWIKPYRNGPLKGWFGGLSGEVKLVITAIEGDDEGLEEGKSDGRLRISSDLGYTIKYGCAVSTDGRISYFSYTAMGAKGGGFPQIDEADQKRLDELIVDLPADSQHLPPPNRRLVLQVPARDGVMVRVYDRANMPDRVLEVLRLVHSNIKSFVLTFKPTEEWKVGAHEALTATLDGSRLITTAGTAPFRFWDPDSHVMLNEIPASQMPVGGGHSSFPVVAERLILSPEGSLLAVDGGYVIDLRDALSLKGLHQFQEWENERQLYRLFNPQFTPDGHYLLIQSNKPELLIFDTRTLQRVALVQGLPAGASGFFSSPHGQPSVYVTAGGEIALWDMQQKRNVASLDSEGQIKWLAYSPDGSMVAAVTLHNASDRSAGSYRMRVWNTENGVLVQELRPFENKAYAVEGLLWWPDGKYLLAVTKSDNFFTSRGVGIWSIGTGRHRAELTGCPGNVTGVALLNDGRLVEGCGDGVARVWKMPEVINLVSAFEGQLLELSHGAGDGLHR